MTIERRISPCFVQIYPTTSVGRLSALDAGDWAEYTSSKYYLPDKLHAISESNRNRYRSTSGATDEGRVGLIIRSYQGNSAPQKL
jgi:hypothetical protein